ncbi:MAG: prolipoprotein diacylglyceryl transferase family protein, partial [Pseudomonadota bacterium]|nr:prolipoprotein diacylglyceryl transferase family protein [Pseudomonadota bacterium]
MFTHPNFDPVIFQIAGPIAIRWYGIAYLTGFLSAYSLGVYRLVNKNFMTKPQFSDLLFYVMLGV